MCSLSCHEIGRPAEPHRAAEGSHRGQPCSESEGCFPWLIVFCLFLFFGLSIMASGGLRRRATTVQIDRAGTARLGGMISLRNEKVRRIALGAAKYLNGGKVAITADKGASFSNVVQVLDWVRAANSNTAPQLLVPPQRPAGREKR
jgi:hypothetical protein